MVLPRWLARANRAVTNPLLRSLVGVGWMAELEHTGRSSNRRYRTVLMVFGRGDAVTVALTYGPGVDWLKNLRAAGGGRLRLGRELLALGPPRTLTTAEGLARMPLPVRWFLPVVGVEDFVELPMLTRRRRR